MKKIFLAIVFSLLAFLATNSTSYAEDCPVVYGGGQIDCAKNQPTVTPSQANPTATAVPQQPAPTSVPNQTKGGLTVQPVTQTTTTPATGPEALGLLALIPTAAAGIFLRRKTK